MGDTKSGLFNRAVHRLYGSLHPGYIQVRFVDYCYKLADGARACGCAGGPFGLLYNFGSETCDVTRVTE